MIVQEEKAGTTDLAESDDAERHELIEELQKIFP